LCEKEVSIWLQLSNLLMSLAYLIQHRIASCVRTRASRVKTRLEKRRRRFGFNTRITLNNRVSIADMRDERANLLGRYTTPLAREYVSALRDRSSGICHIHDSTLSLPYPFGDEAEKSVAGKRVSPPIEIRSALPSRPTSLSRDRSSGCILLPMQDPSPAYPFGEKSVKRRRRMREKVINAEIASSRNRTPPMPDSAWLSCNHLHATCTRPRFIKAACTRPYTRPRVQLNRHLSRAHDISALCIHSDRLRRRTRGHRASLTLAGFAAFAAPSAAAARASFGLHRAG